jgi:hypothetical protein
MTSLEFLSGNVVLLPLTKVTINVDILLNKAVISLSVHKTSRGYVSITSVIHISVGYIVCYGYGVTSRADLHGLSY